MDEPEEKAKDDPGGSCANDVVVLIAAVVEVEFGSFESVPHPTKRSALNRNADRFIRVAWLEWALLEPRWLQAGHLAYKWIRQQDRVS